MEVFIESLFMRLVLKGKFTQLKEQMETADPTLQAWMPYLTAACKFLLRRSFHHLLYEVQVFMRVRVVVSVIQEQQSETATCETEVTLRLANLARSFRCFIPGTVK